jgi:adenylate/guanylate cyclase family protein/resolvase-like protein
VYKVDRLIRALADFVRLVETFDTQSVSFVSVTQQFNTTSSMGRPTLHPRIAPSSAASSASASPGSRGATSRGRIVKTTGDGLLVEFSSVVDALRCATEVQAGMGERNAAVPADRRIEWRIGINVGDIVVEDGDIFGDGVNVAARLEGLAEPGGICVSGSTHPNCRSICLSVGGSGS